MAIGRGVRPWCPDPRPRISSGHAGRRLTRGRRPISAWTLIPALCHAHPERSPALFPRGRRRRGGNPMLVSGNSREVLGIICRGEERSRRRVWAGKTARNVRCGEPVRMWPSSPGSIRRRRSGGSPAEPAHRILFRNRGLTFGFASDLKIFVTFESQFLRFQDQESGTDQERIRPKIANP